MLTTPALLAVRGEGARAAWAAWNGALDLRCDHELTCADGCYDTVVQCAVGETLAENERAAYAAWDAIASGEGVPAEAVAPATPEPAGCCQTSIDPVCVATWAAVTAGAFGVGAGLLWAAVYALTRLRGGL